MEAIQNVLLDYETTEQNWIDNKQKTLDAIARGVQASTDGGGDHPVSELQNQRLLQKQGMEKKWQALVEHWEGVEDDFNDLDKNFELLGDVLSKARIFWKETTCKTTEDLIHRNDEILEQGGKMKVVEERAVKVKATQEKMTTMMESKNEYMGRMCCPILMGLCCCFLFASMTLGTVLRIGVQQGAWKISRNESFFGLGVEAGKEAYKEYQQSEGEVTPTPSSLHINCTAVVHLKCVNDCDVHSGSWFKKCVQNCDVGC